MIVSAIQKAKARTVFSFMFYSVWLYLILAGKQIPETLNNVIMAQLAFYYGNRVARKSNV